MHPKPNAATREVSDMSDGDTSSGGFGLFVLIAVAAGIVLVLNPIEEDHLAALASDLEGVTEAIPGIGAQQQAAQLEEMISFESYYLWSVTRLTIKASADLELEERLVMTVGALGQVWSPADLQLFGKRYHANMKVVQDGLAGAGKVLEDANGVTLTEAERLANEKLAAAAEGAAEVAITAAAVTAAANEAVKETVKAAVEATTANEDG